MSTFLRHTLSRVATPLLIATLVLAGCSDDPAGAEPEPDFTTMRVAVGSQTIDITGAGVTGAPIILVRNVATPIAATFLRANGTADPLVTATSFQMRVTVLSGGVAFARTSAFAGTLTGTAAGPAAVTIDVFHVAEGHAELGRNVAVTVQ